MYRILSIEDNRVDALLISELVESVSSDLKIEFSLNGETALARLKKKSPFQDEALPDLILLDLNLPGKSGLEVLKEIKNEEDIKKIPVIVFSSSERPEDIERSYELQANTYITKPMDLDEYYSILNAIKTYWFHTVKLPKAA